MSEMITIKKSEYDKLTESEEVVKKYLSSLNDLINKKVTRV